MPSVIRNKMQRSMSSMGKYEEITKKLAKIRQFINEENANTNTNTNTSTSTSSNEEESQLVSQVENFHNIYMNMCAKHGPMMGISKASIRHREEEEEEEEEGKKMSNLEAHILELETMNKMLEDENFNLRREIEESSRNEDEDEDEDEGGKNKEKEKNMLATENSTLRKSLSELQCQTFDLQRALEAEDEIIHQLEMDVAERSFNISRMENNEIELLEKLQTSEAERERLGVDLGKVREFIESLEVQLRLTKQRIKVTRSEYKDKEELRKKKLKEMQEKCRVLDDRNRDMEEQMSYMDSTLNGTEECVMKAVAVLIDKIQNLEHVFEARFGDVQRRLVACSEGFRMLRDGLRSVKEKGDGKRASIMSSTTWCSSKDLLV